MSDIRRRQFITLVGGAAVAPSLLLWPLAARAQQPGQVRRVGMLIGYAENDPETQARLTAFRQELEHLGWTEGRNVRIDCRFAPAGPDQAQRFAREPLQLADTERAALPSTLARVGVAGGASYDGLVALEAAAHGQALFTLDRRAQDAYRRLAAAFEVPQ